MFNQRSDVALEGPNPYVRKIGNRFFHKDQIPTGLRYNDQRRDREVLDNLRAQGVPVGPIVPVADEKNAKHLGRKAGGDQKVLSAQQGPIIPAQYQGAVYHPEAQYGAYPVTAVGNPYQQPYAPTVSGPIFGTYPQYGIAAGAPFGYNSPAISTGILSAPTSIPTPYGAPAIGALY